MYYNYGMLQRKLCDLVTRRPNGSLGLTREPFHQLFARSREVVHDLFATHLRTPVCLYSYIRTYRKSKYLGPRAVSLVERSIIHCPYLGGSTIRASKLIITKFNQLTHTAADAY